MAYFEHHRTVRFGECDPAGVVYYPVLFNWFHEAMEDWFEKGLNVPYATILKEFGFPAVRSSAEFRRPFVFGEKSTVKLSVSRLGRSSVHLRFIIVGEDGEEKAIGEVQCVCIPVDNEGFQFSSVEIPSKLRLKMEGFIHHHEDDIES